MVMDEMALAWIESHELLELLFTWKEDSGRQAQLNIAQILPESLKLTSNV